MPLQRSKSVPFAATASDVQQIFAIEQASFGTPWTLEMLRAQMNTPDCFTFVIGDPMKQEHLLAYVLVGRFVDHAQILKLATLPEARRRGYARLLVHYALDWAKQQGLADVQLEFRASNSAAQALYESLGFRVVGRRPRYYGDESAILMTWTSAPTL